MGLFFSHAEHEKTVNAARTVMEELARKKAKGERRKKIPFLKKIKASDFRDRREILKKKKKQPTKQVLTIHFW